MKTLFTLVLVVIMSLCARTTHAQATSGGPDAYGYTWKDSNNPTGPTYYWRDITTVGTQVTGLGDDNTVGPISLGGGFTYYWYSRERFWIGSNGYIAFNNVNIASTANGFPTMPGGTTAPNDYLAPFMCDLKHDGAGNPSRVYTYNNGDTTIISFVDVAFWINANPGGYGGANSFQIVLNRADSSITYNYKTQTGTVDANYTGSPSFLGIGIENVAGTLGLQPRLNVYPVANYSVRFYAPATTTYQVLDAGIDWNQAAGSGGIFVSEDGTAIPLQSAVANVGNQPTPSFTVTNNIQTAAGVISLSNGNATVPAMAPGGSALVNFPNTFNPSAANITTGIYKNTVGFGTNALPADLEPTNNTLVQKIIVVDTTTSLIKLNYADATPTATGLSWNGGNGGVGVYFQPPFYPAQVNSTEYYIQANPNQVGFFAKIYDDNGINGAPGTLLDSVYVDAIAITLNAYTTATISTPITITNGGVYVLWYMDGDGIQIARDNTAPISLRTFENLNGIWGQYRDKSFEDFLIGLNIQKIAAPDLSISQIITPTAGTTTPGTPVKIRLKNTANTATTQPFSLSFQVPGGARITETYSGTPLAVGDSTDYTFATPLYAVSGNLCIKVSYPADANATNDSICVMIQNVATNDLKNTNLAKVYPNPVQNLLYFVFDAMPTNTQINIYNAQGSKIETLTISNQTTYMYNAQKLAQGVYFYEIMQENTHQRGKFVK